MVHDKHREDRLRRMAAQQGLAIKMTPPALGRRTYQLVNPTNKTIVAAGSRNGYGLTLDEVESVLTSEERFLEAVLRLVMADDGAS
jgi:hypothetical protein